MFFVDVPSRDTNSKNKTWRIHKLWSGSGVKNGRTKCPVLPKIDEPCRAFLGVCWPQKAHCDRDMGDAPALSHDIQNCVFPWVLAASSSSPCAATGADIETSDKRVRTRQPVYYSTCAATRLRASTKASLLVACPCTLRLAQAQRCLAFASQSRPAWKNMCFPTWVRSTLLDG